MLQNYLTATDLMNYLYDPRIIYFVYVLKIPQATTTKEIEGRAKYEEFKEKSRRNKIIKELPKLPKIYNVYFASEKYGFATKLDCVAFNREKNEAYPIQAKYSQKPKVLYRSQKFQIIMEAMLIEEKWVCKVPFGFVKFIKSGDFVKVWVTDKLKQELLQIFSEIEDIIRNEKLPKPTPHKKKKVDSCYRNIS